MQLIKSCDETTFGETSKIKMTLSLMKCAYALKIFTKF